MCDSLQRRIHPKSLIAGLAAAWMLGYPGSAGAKPIQVVTTVTDLASIAREVGGDRIEVRSLCKGYQDPHYLEAKPSFAKSLRQADLLIFVGLELEAAWLPRLLDIARNPRLRPGSKSLLEASTAVEHILEARGGGVDRSQGDVHPFGNPHYLLDPRNAVPIAAAIEANLSQLDPDGAEAYSRGLAGFENRMNKQIPAWETRAAGLRGHTVVAFHKQWEYLADWLGLEILGYIENRPGIPPSPRTVNTLIQSMKKQGTTKLLAATFVDLEAAGEVARRSGSELIVLPASVDGVEGTADGVILIETILERLLAGSP